MKHTRRLLILAAAVVGAAGLATAGWAYWSAGGSGSASASVGTLNPPTVGTTTQQGLGTLRVNWTPSTGDVTPTGYYVQRYAGTTLHGYACGSSPALADLKPGPSCDDQGLSAPGPYNYKITAVFRSWTAQSAASNAVSVILDNTPPTVVSINRTAPQPTNAASVSWTVTFSEDVAGVNQADFALVETGEMGSFITGIIGVFGDAATYTVQANTGSGNGILGLDLIDDDTIVDAAGNKLGGTGTINGDFMGQSYTIDKTAPTTTDNASSTWTRTAQTVTLNPADSGGSGVSKTYYTTDGSTPTTNSAQGTSIPFSDEGVYTIKYFSVDTAGNAEAVKTAANQIRIDTTAPTTSDITAAIGNAWKTTTQTVTLSADDGSGSGLFQTYYTIDGSTPTTSSTQGQSVVLSSDGTYQIKYFSVDVAGNTEGVKTAATVIRIDKGNPTGTLSAPAAGPVGGIIPLTAIANDDVSGVGSVQFQVKPNAGTFTNLGSAVTTSQYSASWDTTTVANGSYVLQAVVSDQAGNSITTSSVTVTVSNSFTVALNPSGTKTAGIAFNVTLTAKDADGATITGYSGLRTISFTGAANAPDGTAPTTHVEVTFSNSVGTASVTLVKAETLTLTATQQGGGPTGTVSVTVNPGAATKLAWTALSPTTGSVETPCLFNCTWNEAGRKQNITGKVTVTDNNGNAVSNIGAGHTVTLSKTGGGATTLSPTSLTLPSTGTATTGTFTFTTRDNNGWSTDTVTAKSTGYADATLTVNRQ